MEQEELVSSYQSVRRMSEEICRPLVTEDYVIQSMADVSPPKWHLAHTSWFFERVILQQYCKGYRPYNDQYYYLFNSYYQSFGNRWRRDVRGTLSRPTVKDVYDYRAAIDERMERLLRGEGEDPEIRRLTELGLHHEQQHQELLVTDIKHILASNPLHPVYRSSTDEQRAKGTKQPILPHRFIEHHGGTFELGAGGKNFSWDNERPRHKIFLNDFSLMSRLVTCREYLEFIKDGGYTNPLLWLSDGWDIVVSNGWEAPLYWERVDSAWCIMTLRGIRPIDLEEPVCHVSYYEAAAYACWAGKRLPLEGEWEIGAAALKISAPCGNFLESETFHPVPLGYAPGANPQGLSQMFGDVWEWTGSAYLPYPGYKQEPGPLGEYNGKFMNNQMVLRGGSCATPRSHIRPTYRNFFQGDKRWQFTGIRLASDIT